MEAKTNGRKLLLDENPAAKQELGVSVSSARRRRKKAAKSSSSGSCSDSAGTSERSRGASALTFLSTLATSANDILDIIVTQYGLVDRASESLGTALRVRRLRDDLDETLLRDLEFIALGSDAFRQCIGLWTGFELLVEDEVHATSDAKQT